MKSAFLAILYLISTNASGMGTCRCVQSDPNETTHYGGNLAIVIQEAKSYRSMQGVVHDSSDSVMNNVLVEVFDHPEWLLLPYPQSKEAPPRQRRIMACKTAHDGRFHFAGLPDGKYELRVSVEGGGWDVTHVYVVVARKGRIGSRQELNVQMQLGT